MKTLILATLLVFNSGLSACGSAPTAAKTTDGTALGADTPTTEVQPEANTSATPALAKPAAVAASGALAGQAGNPQPVALALIDSALPTCDTAEDGVMYYVSEDSAFKYCDAATTTWTAISLVGSAGASGSAGANGSSCSVSGSGLMTCPGSGTGAPSTYQIPAGAVGPQGQAGAQGVAGAAGAAGSNGNTILSGAANPTSGQGNNGDFYLNTTSDVLFGPKASGAWPGSGTSLVGATGATGATGAAGSGTTNNVLTYNTATQYASSATNCTNITSGFGNFLSTGNDFGGSGNTVSFRVSAANSNYNIVTVYVSDLTGASACNSSYAVGYLQPSGLYSTGSTAYLQISANTYATLQAGYLAGDNFSMLTFVSLAE